ncbi:glycosyltransferase [Hoylesella shahii]|uniref:glycosyltransferase n=1 Tax=Hoylesella shahii TaxID=228603 RepID=UPI0028ED962C|nr:glycosyltransferase [Hoylesella shahii]
MRILQVITSLQTGGAEKIVVDVTRIMRDRGHIVDVVVFNGIDTPFMEDIHRTGCKVYSFSNGGSVYNPLHILRLVGIMKKYDVVHSHNTSPQFFVAAANLLSGLPIVTTEHNTTNRRRNNPLWKPLDKWMYNRYKKIICISDQAEQNLKEYLCHCNTPIEIIYNGVDVDFIYNSKPLTTEKSNKFVVLMVAAFRKQKDQITLINAISLLPEEEFELWLVGRGDCLDEVRAYADAKGMHDRVKFWGNRTDVANVLHTADVVCMSSHYEGLSLSNIEGMSSGRPFIASDVDGLREVTKGYGVLFPHEDAEALAGIIQKLHDDKAYYDEIAEKCYQRALMFDIKVMMDKYEDVYKSLVSK